jgi:uncharacterized membrane protein YedE/YeeE
VSRRSPLLPIATAAGAGLIFGLGLAISQMTDPEKVKAFLDIAAIWSGTWDPSLVFVMGAGLLVTVVFFRLARPMPAPIVSASFATPRPGRIDSRLVVGSAVFGLGWGLSGLCPGPAIADVGLAPGEFALFAAAMLAGSWGAGAILRTLDQGGEKLAGGNVPAS